MKSIGFHKASTLKGQALCYVCKTNLLPLAKGNRPCDECKKKQIEYGPTSDVGVQFAKRDASAVIETESGQEVFVDKFGNDVDNPGYDTKNDPRGWRRSGTKKKTKIIT